MSSGDGQPARWLRRLGVNIGMVYLAKHRVMALIKKEIRALEKRWKTGRLTGLRGRTHSHTAFVTAAIFGCRITWLPTGRSWENKVMTWVCFCGSGGRDAAGYGRQDTCRCKLEAVRDAARAEGKGGDCQPYRERLCPLSENTLITTPPNPTESPTVEPSAAGPPPVGSGPRTASPHWPGQRRPSLAGAEHPGHLPRRQNCAGTPIPAGNLGERIHRHFEFEPAPGCTTGWWIFCRWDAMRRPAVFIT